MGYETDFTVSIYESDSIPVDIDLDGELSELSGYDFHAGEIYARKWYDHEKDMQELSRKYPNNVFLVDGAGEEFGDIWKKYFKNGKMQRINVEFVFAPFDEDSLK